MHRSNILQVSHSNKLSPSKTAFAQVPFIDDCFLRKSAWALNSRVPKRSTLHISKNGSSYLRIRYSLLAWNLAFIFCISVSRIVLIYDGSLNAKACYFEKSISVVNLDCIYFIIINLKPIHYLKIIIYVYIFVS